MAVNDKITRNEYNNIRTKVINVLGAGSGNTGYGQPIRSSTVGVSNKVTINEWGNLKYDIINAYVHQNGSAPSLPDAVENASIRYNATDAPVAYWDTVATNLQTNRFAIHTSQKITTNHGSNSITFPNATYGSYWGQAAGSDELSCLVTVSFTTSNEARYFFNSGGYINFSSSRTGGSTTPQNTSWTSLLSTGSATTPRFGGAHPSTGTSPADNQNFYRCTSTYSSPFYSVSASSPYGSNTWRIYARTPGVVNNSSGTASSIEFRISWLDGHTALGAGPDAVNGTVTVQVASLQAFGTLQPPGAGDFSVQTPTVTIGSIVPQ